MPVPDVLEVQDERAERARGAREEAREERLGGCWGRGGPGGPVFVGGGLEVGENEPECVQDPAGGDGVAEGEEPGGLVVRACGER